MFVLVGAATMLLLDAHSSVPRVAASCFVIGLGMGTTVSPTLIAAQSRLTWRERGVVTANNLFLRSIGSSLGVAVFGAIANATLGSSGSAPGSRVDPALLAHAVHGVFTAIVVVAAVAVFAVTLMPRHQGRPS